ncbi:MAG: hypothetical protein AB1921_12055 [Thermodesulfobacteriota bacterium]
MKADRKAYPEKAQALRCMTAVELLRFFGGLEPPDFSEMDGEYEATLLNQGSDWTGTAHLSFLNGPLHGFWLGKAFTPASRNDGHGYNMFFRSGQVRRHYRMSTTITASRFDGKPAFRLLYSDYNSLCGYVRMIDEVRRVDEGLYLGIGAYGIIRKTPLPFILRGPIGPFLGSDKEEKWPFKRLL